MQIVLGKRWLSRSLTEGGIPLEETSFSTQGIKLGPVSWNIRLIDESGTDLDTLMNEDQRTQTSGSGRSGSGYFRQPWLN